MLSSYRFRGTTNANFLKYLFGGRGPLGSRTYAIRYSFNFGFEPFDCITFFDVFIPKYSIVISTSNICCTMTDNYLDVRPIQLSSDQNSLGFKLGGESDDCHSLIYQATEGENTLSKFA